MTARLFHWFCRHDASLPAVLVAAVLAATASDARGADESATTAATTGASSQTFVVRHVRVFDGVRLAPMPADVYVKDGIIAAVGRDVRVPAGVASVDGSGRTLLPGLIDAHTHSWGEARRDALRFGVTTELDMFGDYHEIAAARRDREQHGPVAVADLWSAGTLATVPHGHGTEYGIPIPTLTTPAEAPAFVAARFAEGSDYLKIIIEDGSAFGRTIASLDAPTVDALVAAAHAMHRQAVAHVATEAEAITAIDARIDGLAHVWMDRVGDDATMRRVRRSKAFVVATLSVAASAGGAHFGQTLVDDERVKPFLTSQQAGMLRAAFPSRRDALFTNAVENVRRLHAAGVPVLAGTDSGNAGTTHGASLHGELELLVRAGLTPSEALAAATTLPTAKFHLGDRGRVASGMRADLLLVDGDPTTDIRATRAIVAIWKNGAPVDRTPEATAPEAAAAAANDATIADFEGGAIAARSGQNWVVTSDQMVGGKSSATQTWIAGGADGSKGAMRVSGIVTADFAFAWGGTLWMPGAQPFAAVDFSARKTLVFKVRGDARTLSAMVFSGPATNRTPSIVPFDATADWKEVRIPLARFDGADIAQLRGLAFTAGLPAGPFTFDIDDVRIE